MRKVGRPKGRTFEIKLTAQQRKHFIECQKKGKHSARVLQRMRIVLLADQGLNDKQISKRERLHHQTVYNTLKKFAETKNLGDLPRTGRPEKLSGLHKAHLIAKATTDAPKGHSRWTLRLLADHAVQLEEVESISRTTVARILKKTNLNLGEKKLGVSEK